ncbi:MAG: N-acetyltransferase [Candidatus Caenarcaniphilales bacterium]|nr:N-acetyltransferase [Candidatus Caenarcaniphilales bacterium]
MKQQDYKIIKPVAGDVDEVWGLINYFAETSQELLPRNRNQILEQLLSFWIAKKVNSKGSQKEEVIGCSSLHIWTNNLSEIKSLAVKQECQGKGIGKKLIDKCIEDAKNLGQREIFALTFRPAFFYKQGFRETSKDNLPHKVWNECIHCPKLLTCGEVPVIFSLNDV